MFLNDLVHGRPPWPAPTGGQAHDAVLPGSHAQAQRIAAHGHPLVRWRESAPGSVRPDEAGGEIHVRDERRAGRVARRQKIGSVPRQRRQHARGGGVAQHVDPGDEAALCATPV